MAMVIAVVALLTHSAGAFMIEKSDQTPVFHLTARLAWCPLVQRQDS